jgi:predicted alpha/beta hydrolase
VRQDDKLDKELRFHVDSRIDGLIASGNTPDEARRQARLEFGGMTQTKEAIADESSWRFLDGSLSDLRLAIRSLRRTPIFTLTAAIVLGLGIGANATVFTIVNTLLVASSAPSCSAVSCATSCSESRRRTVSRWPLRSPP